MKISRIGLALVCLSVCVSSAGAQAPAKAVSTLPKVAARVERQAAQYMFNGYGALVPPPNLPSPVPAAMLTQPLTVTGTAPFNPVVSPQQRQEYVAPRVNQTVEVPVEIKTSTGYVSPLRDFLRDEKDEWEMPELSSWRATSCGFASCWGDDMQERAGRMGVDPLRSVAIDFGMPLQVSRESLQMRAQGVGIPAENIEHASSAELWLLISLYETLAQSGQIVSRFDEFAKETGTEKNSAAIANWAAAQPDFRQENYIYKEYYEPFNPHVTQLRVLVINDSKKYVNPLREIAAHDSRITVEHVDSVVAAFPALKSKKPKYDVVLTDYYTHAGNALELSMWAYKHGVNTPIVFFSNADGSAGWLYSYNIAGRIALQQPARAVLNYLSNIVATGTAYPGH